MKNGLFKQIMTSQQRIIPGMFVQHDDWARKHCAVVLTVNKMTCELLFLMSHPPKTQHARIVTDVELMMLNFHARKRTYFSYARRKREEIYCYNEQIAYPQGWVDCLKREFQTT